MANRISRGQAYLAYLIAAAGMIGISVAASLLPGLPAWALILGYYLLCLALPCGLIVRRSGCVDAIRPEQPKASSLLPVILLSGLALGVVNGVTVLWEIPFEMAGMNTQTTELMATDTAFQLALSVIVNAAIPALCEELLFRGVILSALEGYGTRRAVIASSLLFMCLHGSIIGAPAEFLLGIVLCLIVITTKSIWSGIIFHTIYNALIIVINHAVGSGDGTQTVLESIGGTRGLVSVVIDIALFALPSCYFIRALLYRAKAEHVVVYPRRRVKLPGLALAALIAAMVIVAVMYLSDFCLMAGVIA